MVNMKKFSLICITLLISVIVIAQQRPRLSTEILYKVSYVCLSHENYLAKFANYANIDFRNAAIDSLEHIFLHPRCAELYLEGMYHRYGERGLSDIGFNSDEKALIISYLAETEGLRATEAESMKNLALMKKEQELIDKYEGTKTIDYAEADTKPSVNIQSNLLIDKIEELYYQALLPELEKTLFSGISRKLVSFPFYITESGNIDYYTPSFPPQYLPLWKEFINSTKVYGVGMIRLPYSGKSLKKSVRMEYSIFIRPSNLTTDKEHEDWVTIKKSPKSPGGFKISNRKSLVSSYGESYVKRLESYLFARPKMWSSKSKTELRLGTETLNIKLQGPNSSSVFETKIQLVTSYDYYRRFLE